MRQRTRLLLAGLVLVTAAPRPLDACAIAPPEGMRVRVVQEEALIAWSAATKMEHFIRRAAFATDAKNFGFLVPTPTVPTLAEAPNAIFRELAELTKPKVLHETRWEPAPLSIFCCLAAPLLMTAGKSAAPRAGTMSGEPVRVLDEKTVAGYDAAVLEADDAAALARWLEENGYPSRPELEKWFEPLTRDQWKITAFKFSRDAAAKEGMSSKAVRLSFPTDRPFYPYREPADMREGARTWDSRSLRVYFASDRRMEGTLGAGATAASWPHAVKFADAVPGLDLEGAVPAGALPKAPWLTVFLDESSPRPGTDEVYFTPEKTGAAVIPPPIVLYYHKQVPIPVDLVWVVPAILVFRRWRKKKATAA